jgi:hypothetical protein
MKFYFHEKVLRQYLPFYHPPCPTENTTANLSVIGNCSPVLPNLIILQQSNVTSITGYSCTYISNGTLHCQFGEPGGLKKHHSLDQVEYALVASFSTGYSKQK